ncbi:hypothetical protein D3C72_1804910 [compost metagenome]
MIWPYTPPRFLGKKYATILLARDSVLALSRPSGQPLMMLLLPPTPTVPKGEKDDTFQNAAV